MLAGAATDVQDTTPDLSTLGQRQERSAVPGRCWREIARPAAFAIRRHRRSRRARNAAWSRVPRVPRVPADGADGGWIAR